MSCYRPIHINNKTAFYLPGKDKMKLLVPCGHCHACRSKQQRQWTLRAYYEIKHTRLLGGETVFLTFTFDDKHLPKFVFHNEQLAEHHVIPCFSHDIVKNFLKKIRKDIFRKYNLNGIKYFWTSEYGERTKRPHHHALFHLPPKIDVNYFLEKCRQYWLHGFVYPKSGLIHEAVVHHEKETSTYVSKYVNKDLSYFSSPAIEAFLHSKNVYFDNGQLNVLEYQKRLKALKPYLPKHWQSNGYGLYLLDEIQKSDHPLDFFKNGIIIGDDTSSISIPPYIVDKICYDHKYYDDFGNYYECYSQIPKDLRNSVHTARNLNKFGINVKKTLFHHNINVLSTKFRDIFSLPFLELLSRSEFLQYFPTCENRHQAFAYIHKLMHKRDYKQLAIYSLFYQDYNSNDEPINTPLSVLINGAYAYHLKRIRFDNFSIPPHPNSIRSREGKHIDDSYNYTYNQFVCFTGFDEILRIFSSVSYCLQTKHYEALAELEQKRKLAHELFSIKKL